MDSERQVITESIQLGEISVRKWFIDMQGSLYKSVLRHILGSGTSN